MRKAEVWRLRALDMEAEDEYHWALQTGPTTVRQWVSRLLGLGLVYDPTDCIMATKLLALGADRPAQALVSGQPVRSMLNSKRPFEPMTW